MKIDDPWVAIAIISRPHALRGGALLKALTRDPEELLTAPYTKVSVRRRGKILRELTFRHRALHKGKPYVFFEEIADRTQLEEYLGCELVIRREERVEPEEGKFYLDDMEGLTLVEDATGSEIGTVLRGEEGLAHDYLIIQVTDRGEKEFMLPLVPDFVRVVDPESHSARVFIPEGLLDL